MSSAPLVARGLRCGTAAAVALLGGCLASTPTANDAPAAKGAAGGATAVGADERLKSCPEPVGTVRLYDGMTEQGAHKVNLPPGTEQWVALAGALRGGNRNSSPQQGNVSLDSLRLLIQQSNCFLIVDRGAAEMAADDEKRRARNSGEVRDGANMGQGQEVAADFVLRSQVIRFDNTGNTNAGAGGLLPKFLGTVSVGKSTSEAEVQLVLSDLRSKVQVAVAQGASSGSNTKLASNVLGVAGKVLGGGTISTEQKTSGTTILLQAFADAYNKMVPALVNYKTQNVRGGAGTGGTLKVQGSRRDPSEVAQP